MKKLVLPVIGGVLLTLLALTLPACGSSMTANTKSPVADTVTVTTIAGTAGAAGSANGTGVAARFAYPRNIAADADGNLYVTDHLNLTVRKITTAGVVTTWRARPAPWAASKAVARLRFSSLDGIACDAAGNLYVTEFDGDTILKITPTGMVTTLAGKAPPRAVSTAAVPQRASTVPMASRCEPPATSTLRTPAAIPSARSLTRRQGHHAGGQGGRQPAAPTAPAPRPA